jgi:hypothetical protein
MKARRFLLQFLVFFVLVFVVSAVVSYLWSLIAHGHGLADWPSSFRFAVILGVVLPFATGGPFKPKEGR